MDGWSNATERRNNATNVKKTFLNTLSPPSVHNGFCIAQRKRHLKELFRESHSFCREIRSVNEAKHDLGSLSISILSKSLPIGFECRLQMTFGNMKEKEVCLEMRKRMYRVRSLLR